MWVRVGPGSPAILLMGPRLAIPYGGRRGSSAEGQGVDTWSASASGCLRSIFLLFSAKETSDPEVVGLALWRVGLRITLNGVVCTVDNSVVFRARCRTWN